MDDAGRRLRDALREAHARLAAREGEAEALKERARRLEAEVGLAKGRLAQKAKVDLFLEELQAEAHARRVGDFERLLTALVSEVLPQEAPIGLELEIERGQPSLDIVSRHSADRSEDIYEDQGGALTNVVSMGLRMIAVVRSGMQRFLVLDESDCWISNKRVGAFYSVLKDAARKIDVQCLAISHHEVSTFGEGVNVATLSGHPEASGGVRVENNPRPYRWSDEEKGIRFIRLRNFQGYVDETFHLSPGVNAISGENNVGKSSFVRAFRAVFYGEARDSLIRRGERHCVVEIGFPGGRVLRWDRQLRRNPVNSWKLLGPDGSVVAEDGMTYETGGRTVPEWVPELFRIGPVEGLDVHAIKQKTPVFLLDKPGSTRAAVLSVGQESGHVRKMISLHKEQCARDAAAVKDGEAEMSTILRRIEALKGTEKAREAIKAAEARLAEAEKEAADAAALVPLAEALSSARSALERARRKAAALAGLPADESMWQAAADAARTEALAEAERRLAEARAHHERLRKARAALTGLPDQLPALESLQTLESAAAAISDASARIRSGKAVAAAMAALPAEAPEIERNDERIKAGRGVKDARLALGKAQSRKAAFEGLPDALPVLEDAAHAAEALEAVRTGAARAAAASETAAKAARDMEACRDELDALVAEMGNACPLCGHGIEDAAAFLTAHAHAHGERREADHA